MVVLGNTLYVAESTAGAVAKGLDRPRWLVATGGLILVANWFQYEDGQLVSINPTTEAVRLLSFVTQPCPGTGKRSGAQCARIEPTRTK